MKNRLFLAALVLSLASTLVIADFGAFAPTEATAAEPIVLKGVTALPKSHPDIYTCIPKLVDMVHKRSGGKIKIDYLGGPEVIGSFEQADALMNGIIHLQLYTPLAYMAPRAPETEAGSLSKYAPWEERKVGIFDLWDEIFQKRLKSKYLGRLAGVLPYHLYSTVKIEKLADFEGKIFRTHPLYAPLYKALGAKPVTIPPADLYTALERGTVEGTYWPEAGITGFALEEIVKYELWPGIWQMQPGTLMNLDTWNKIPKELQDVINECMEDAEYIAVAARIWEGQLDWEYKMKPAGVKRVMLPPEEVDRYVELAYSAKWEDILKHSPEYGPRLKKLFSREKK
jgi:TRAP-type C4-dicarboxylate transport system substrate-binding protein